MVTYLVIGIFVVMCLTLVFEYSRLMQLQHEAINAEAKATQMASLENDAADAAARDRYNRAVSRFPTNLVALVTGFTARD